MESLSSGFQQRMILRLTMGMTISVLGTGIRMVMSKVLWICEA